MKEHNIINGAAAKLSRSLISSVLRQCFFRILSAGPIPNHIAFIMDGNRRYAKRKNLEEGAGHRAGYSALMSVIRYCYELGVKYVTIYAFSIDNFKRQRDEVQSLMDLMLEKFQSLLAEDSIVNEYGGIRVYFLGNLKLLNEPVRIAAENVMRVTAKHTKRVLLICVAYTSRDEIVHAVQECCVDKRNDFESFNTSTLCSSEIKELRDDVQNADKADEFVATLQDSQHLPTTKSSSNAANVVNASEKPSIIKVADIEKHLYTSVASDPDLLIRSSGETRLSNFLLWQTSNCPLYSPKALWPEIGLWQLVWGVLTYQRNYFYLEKKKKQS